MKYLHRPVMLEEVLSFFKPFSGMTFLDGTIGEGGHSEAIVEKIIPGGTLIGIDRDSSNLARASERLKSYASMVKLFQGSYGSMKDFLKSAGLKGFDGILLDLGFSTRHIFDAGRGFSFMKDEPVDMRYDSSAGVPAHRWLAEAPEDEIAGVIREFGEERDARRIAKRIKKSLEEESSPITGLRLAKIVSSAKRTKTSKNPATKTFQAIRIFINRELEELEKGLNAGLHLLVEGGRFGVITYHSTEDRIVKKKFREYERRCTCPTDFPVCICNESEKTPLVSVWKGSGSSPSSEEISSNPSARSARLRGCEIRKAFLE